MKKIIFATSILLVLLFLASGCFRNNQFTTDKRTSYVVVDAKGYITAFLKEQHPDVVRIKELTQEYLTLEYTRDFKTTDGKETLHLSSRAFADYTLSAGLLDDAAKYIRRHQLDVDLIGIEEKTIIFNSELNVAETTFILLTEYIHATPNYIKQNKIKLNTPYKGAFQINFTKEANIWKIDDVLYEPEQLK